MLLIDEVDRVEVETEALLEVLSDYQVSIPELGTIGAAQIPLVFLYVEQHSRAVRGAQAALPVPAHRLPRVEREKAIVLAKVPDISDNLADQIARIVRSIRQIELKKAPSVSETLDWRDAGAARHRLHRRRQAKETLHILLKYQSDITKAAKELRSTSTRCLLCCRGSSKSCAARLPVSLTENLDAMEAVTHPDRGSGGVRRAGATS